MRLFIALFATLLIVSCSDKKDKQWVYIPKLKNDSISVIELKEITFNDSIVRYSDDKRKTVIYTNNLAHNKVHYKIINNDSTLLEIGYTKDSAYFDPIFEGDYFRLVDYVTQYRQNGTLQRQGFIIYEDSLSYIMMTKDYDYWDIYCDYDSTGTLTYKHFPTYPGSNMAYIGEDYHRNGRIKSRWKQVDVFAAFFSGGHTQWDEKGHKVEETTVDHRMPKGGSSYNDVFIVSTTTKYYTNGNIKEIIHDKSFTESESCPCGEWKYYNKDGELIKTIKHKPCYNFKLDCDYETEQ